MKKCPFCAEEIQVEAVVCKHCGKSLAPAPTVVVVKEPAPRVVEVVETTTIIEESV